MQSLCSGSAPYCQRYAEEIIMSKKGRKKKNVNEYILLNDVIYILRISPQKIHELTNIKNIKIYQNEFGTQFLKQNDFKELAYCDEIIEARIELNINKNTSCFTEPGLKMFVDRIYLGNL